MATNPPDTVVHSTQDATGQTHNKSSDPIQGEEAVAAVHYTPLEDRKSQIIHHNQFKTEYFKIQEPARRERVDISSKY